MKVVEGGKGKGERWWARTEYVWNSDLKDGTELGLKGPKPRLWYWILKFEFVPWVLLLANQLPISYFAIGRILQQICWEELLSTYNCTGVNLKTNPYKNNSFSQWEFGGLVKLGALVVWTDSAEMGKVWDDPILHQTRPAALAYRWAALLDK